MSPRSGGFGRDSSSRIDDPKRVRTQLHIALRHRQFLVPRQLLNRFAWRALHRQVRTERVTQDVHARRHTSEPHRSSNARPGRLTTHRPSIVLADHPWPSEMPGLAKHFEQPLREWDVAHATILRRRELASAAMR